MSSRRKKKEQTLAQALGAFLEKVLVPDLRARARAPAVAAVLKQRWEHERAQERTAEQLEPWVDQTVEQVGAAWILSCVFVRTLEDRGLVSRRRLAGEGAADSEHYFNELAPSLNARDYLLTVFRELSRFPGTEELLGPKGNPAWRLTPSSPAAQALLDFFRERTEEGSLRWTFGVPAGEAGADTRDGHDTRFLGDLYQDLSASVRERYALLQTPDFVERFILGLALDPAIREFGLEEVRVIDPTCGSGHFLLGAYDRLFEARLAAKPGLDRRQHALDALAQVYGVDINPYAVAIARFRLTLSYLHKAGIDRLADAPKLPPNLVVADSLLYGAQGPMREFAEIAGTRRGWDEALFTLEEPERAMEVLSRGYHAVVGNPPYITCKDAKLREKYRELYPRSAAGKYALAAPFTERFFQLASPSGFVGLINANSFMKREFGKKLIEEVLPRLDLSHVIDTSGAFIPGHGTPTVILIGRNREPSAAPVRAVLGKRGEPETPAEPERGKVWSSIVGHLGEVGFEDEYVSVADVERATFDKHPWSLGGGGAAELKELLERRGSRRLGEIADSIGISSVTGEDDVYLMPADAARRLRLEHTRPMVTGETLRDWSLTVEQVTAFPYDDDLKLLPIEALPATKRLLWVAKPVTRHRKRFGVPMLERGLTWYELQELYANKLRTPLSIAFAFVATHNHFVLDRGGKVFNRSGPIIKLPEGATEEDHLALLGYLNSSTACFWMKQTFFDKGNRGEGGGTTAEKWEKFFEFDATKLSAAPVPDGNERVLHLARLLDQAGQKIAESDAAAVLGHLSPESDLVSTLEVARATRAALEGKVRWLQEELDWEVYPLFGLPSSTRTSLPQTLEDVPCREKGTRPSDRLYAERVLSGGETSRYLDLCALPSAEVIVRMALAADDQERLALIERTPELRLIEVPTYKRTFREGHRPWDPSHAIHDRLLSWAEKVVSDSSPDAAPLSLRQVISRAIGTAEKSLSALLGPDYADSIPRLALESAVPFLASYRLTDSGQNKLEAWQHTWSLQRREDAGEKDLEIPVPPKYDQKDYRDPVFWRLRGKLDVPKERFISYPGAERDDDKSPLIGWAGWDHLQRAQALAALYLQRKNQDGWEKERLKPLLAGLLELVPWLQQWHNDPSDDPAKDRAGDAYARFVDEEARGFGLTLEDLRAWRPEPARKPRGRKAAVKKVEAAE